MTILLGHLAPTANNGDWSVTVKVVDAEDNTLIDLTGSSIQVAVRNDRGGTILTGSTDDEKVIIEGTGIFTWMFPASTMQTVRPQTYKIGCRIIFDEDDDPTVSIISGTIAVFDGVAP